MGKLQKGRCGQAAKIIGVDPGMSGALATWDGVELTLFPMLTEKAKGRGRVVLWDEQASLLQPAMNSIAAYLERVSTRPGEGRVSAFKFGYVAGGIRGILAQAAIPTTLVTPQIWKKYFGLTAHKKDAVELAASRFPDNKDQFYGPRGGIKDGMAEAALIALYGYNMEIENV